MFQTRLIAVIEGICRRFRNSSECLKTHCAANNCPIWTQKSPKEALRVGLQTSTRDFPKICCCTRTAGGQKFVYYICMLYTGGFILNGIVY